MKTTLLDDHSQIFITKSLRSTCQVEMRELLLVPNYSPRESHHYLEKEELHSCFHAMDSFSVKNWDTKRIEKEIREFSEKLEGKLNFREGNSMLPSRNSSNECCKLEQLGTGTTDLLPLFWQCTDSMEVRWGKNRWHPPLQPKPPVRYGHIMYCFEAHMNKTWTT